MAKSEEIRKATTKISWHYYGADMTPNPRYCQKHDELVPRGFSCRGCLLGLDPKKDGYGRRN